MKRFWCCALLLLAGYVTLALWFPAPGRADQLPLADVRAFAPALEDGLRYALLVCLLFAGYWLAYRLLLRSVDAPIWAIWLMTLLFGVALILCYPLNAVDVFRYFYEGRMMVAYGANPFTTPPDALADDPMLPFAAILLKKSSPYGPLWELIGAAVYWISRGSVWWSLILFKAIGLTCHMAAGLVIWQVLGGRARQVRMAQLLLWLWNPALLLMFVMDAHNDSLMLLCLLLGYRFIHRGESLVGLLVLSLAPLVKPIGVLPVPFFAIMAWQQTPNWQQRFRLLLFAGLGGALITFLAFLPFGSPLPLLHRLMNESQTGPSFSPVDFAIALGRRYGVEHPIQTWARASSLVLGLATLWLLWLTWRGRAAVRGTADVFAAYLITALKFRIWYPTWIFPWLVLDVEGRVRLYTGLWLLLLSQLSVVHYSHIRLAWLDGHFPTSLLYGVPVVFAGPPLLAFVASKLSRQRRRPPPRGMRQPALPDPLQSD